MIDLVTFLGGCVVVSVILSIGINRVRPKWSKAGIAMLSALPISLIVILLCLALYLTAAFSSDEACGVDACGMAMNAARVIGGVAVLGFALGLIASAATLTLLRRR